MSCRPLPLPIRSLFSSQQPCSLYCSIRRLPSIPRKLQTRNMASKDTLYISSTPDDVKNAKGLSLLTQNTPNGQATQIMLEELALKYGTKWDTKLINISTNIQKEECMHHHSWAHPSTFSNPARRHIYQFTVPLTPPPRRVPPPQRQRPYPHARRQQQEPTLPCHRDLRPTPLSSERVRPQRRIRLQGRVRAQRSPAVDVLLA